MLGADLAAYLDVPAPFSFATWDEALDALFTLGGGPPAAVIIDEFPYLVDACPALPSLLPGPLIVTVRRKMAAAG